jgi:hypothetical protein
MPALLARQPRAVNGGLTAYQEEEFADQDPEAVANQRDDGQRKQQVEEDFHGPAPFKPERPLC